ncbi:MAG: hypothetical protein JST40_12940 [Armatimonadetes bacterium]|nr:hypothetical protein [Armatimonadota bacterium]
MLLTSLALALAPNQSTLDIKLSRTIENKEEVFVAAATNISSQDVALVPQIDGSETGMRGPVAQFQVKVGNDWKAFEFGPRCGNTNPLEKDYFKMVQPNGSQILAKMSLTSGMYLGAIGNPGKHQIRFVYDTTMPLERWIGGPLPEDLQQQRVSELKSLLDRVPKGRYISNAITVQVRRARES